MAEKVEDSAKDHVKLLARGSDKVLYVHKDEVEHWTERGYREAPATRRTSSK